MLINLIWWIVFGAVIGLLASVVVQDKRYGLVGTVVVGIVGAILGGFVSRLFGGPDVSGFNLTSILVATLGAVLLLFILRVLGGRANT